MRVRVQTQQVPRARRHARNEQGKAELMSTTSQQTRRSGAKNLPIIVITTAAAVILSLSMGLRQSLGLFQAPIYTDLAVSASSFGFAMALQSIVWGLSQPFVGMLGDRYGARPVVMGCAAIYALGLFLMAWSGPFLGLNIGAGLLVGIGIAGTGFGVLLGAVARVVPASRRVQTLGVVAAAGSLATLALAPLGQYLIDVAGWRMSVTVFVIVAASMALLGVLMGRKPIVDEPVTGNAESTLGDTLRAAARHPGFVAMTIAFFACGFQLMFITVHLPAFLAICGVGPSVSATALGVIGLGNAVGSYAAGYLGARYSQKRLLALAYLLRTVAIVTFVSMPVSPESTIVFAAAMGVLWLGVVPLVSGLIGKLFGLQHFNTLFGFAFFSHQVGAFLGSWLGGLSFDVTGSYTVAWVSLIVVGASAFLLQWFMDDRPRLRNASPALASASAS